jgi:multidrug resistance efflux pump
MLFILALYAALLWLLFSKFKLVKWGWISGTLAVLGGAFILAVFLAMFNHLTPSGSFTVVSRVIEMTPNVSGLVTAIPVKPMQSAPVPPNVRYASDSDHSRRRTEL